MDNPNEKILKTEFGTPIGDLVIAGDHKSAETDDFPARVRGTSTDDMTRQLAQTLTGDSEDSTLNDLFPSYTDGDKRKMAARLFVIEHKTFREIEEIVGVPERTVSRWAYDHQWPAASRQDLSVRQAMSLYDLGKLRVENRVPVAKAQLAGAAKIRKAALRALEEGGSLKSAADAFKSASDVENRVLGISESGSIADIDGSTPDSSGRSKQDNGKTPLVMVFQGGLPPVRKAGEPVDA